MKLNRLLRFVTNPRRMAAMLAAGMRDPAALRLARRCVVDLTALQSPLELYQLIRYLKRRPPECVVEIGTMHGGNLHMLCEVAADDATIISVDLQRKQGEDQVVSRLRALAREGQTLHLIRGNSHELATFEKIEEALRGAQVDFLFVDGDHSFEGVKQDFEMYSPLVTNGGLIAFHDIVDSPDPSHAWIEVPRFWREIAPFYSHEEFWDRTKTTKGKGIGVISWRTV